MSRKPSSPPESVPYNHGGYIGPATDGNPSDNIPIILRSGEFILAPATARAITSAFSKLRDPLENMKAALEHTAFKFANGGFVNGIGANGLYYDQDGYPEPPPPD